MLNTALENLLNRGLPRSPRARALCAELAGKSLAIEARDLTRLRIRCNGVTLEVVRDAAPADASLAGGPLSLLGLLGNSPQALLQSGAVRMGGDAELAQKFHELLGHLRPDAEEELALLLGDVPAHGLARLARRGLEFAQRAADTGITNAAEYLGHERAHLVPRAEGEQFLRGVDAVREGVDRAAARLENLARRRGAQ
jgi:ubiquinone biosynthesis accessory factor UbiJ